VILIIDNYDSFVHNIARYVRELGREAMVVRNDAIAADTMAEVDAVIISPGPCTPNEAGASLAVVRSLAGRLPMLGICLGHQCIGQAFGGRVVRAGHVMHGKTSPVTHEGSGLFAGLPSPFRVTRYHSLIVERKKLPDNLMVTAKTGDGLIMGLQHKTHPVHGVQFHPESIASEHGHALLANFLELAGISPRRPNVRPVRHAA
jgi:anthranilate synthase component 2